MDVNSDCYHYIVRMCKTFSQPNDCQIRAIFHDIPILPINFFTLLCMVGLCQLLQRRFLQSMEPSNVFHGKYSCCHCVNMRLTYLLIKWFSVFILLVSLNFSFPKLFTIQSIRPKMSPFFFPSRNRTTLFKWFFVCVVFLDEISYSKIIFKFQNHNALT